VDGKCTTAPVDGGLPDAGLADLGDCSADQGINIVTQCDQQCQPWWTPDGDCDGLKDSVQDRWPGQCNRLLLAEGFVDPPDPARWLTGYTTEATHTGADCGEATCGDSDNEPCRCRPGDPCLIAEDHHCGGSSPEGHWACGSFTIGPGDRVKLLQTDSLPDPSYMIELRFKITNVADPDSWRVGVVGNSYKTTLTGTAGDVEITVQRQCEIWVDRKPNVWCPTGCSPNVSAHMNHNAEALMIDNQQFKTGGWTDTAGRIQPANVQGKPFLLQFWGDSLQQHCELIEADGGSTVVSMERSNSMSGYDITPKQSGTIQVVVDGCTAEVDYVRVYDHDL
jgi:hypothetical protein